jgi:hypothetical protein
MPCGDVVTTCMLAGPKGRFFNFNSATAGAGAAKGGYWKGARQGSTCDRIGQEQKLLMQDGPGSKKNMSVTCSSRPSGGPTGGQATGGRETSWWPSPCSDLVQTSRSWWPNILLSVSKIWMLAVCYERLDKYIAEALQPITKIHMHKAFDNVVVRHFYSLLRPIIIRANSVGLLKMLSNDQTLFAIMGKMSTMD